MFFTLTRKTNKRVTGILT